MLENNLKRGTDSLSQTIFQLLEVFLGKSGRGSRDTVGLVQSCREQEAASWRRSRV